MMRLRLNDLIGVCSLAVCLTRVIVTEGECTSVWIVVSGKVDALGGAQWIRMSCAQVEVRLKRESKRTRTSLSRSLEKGPVTTAIEV
jgi:hypothetical protein